jgi:hypothetical protein
VSGALTFDPWTAVKNEAGGPAPVNPAKVANSPPPPPPEFATFAGFTEEPSANQNRIRNLRRVHRGAPLTREIGPDPLAAPFVSAESTVSRLPEREELASDAYVRRAAMQRPPSWSDAATVPVPGCFCSCCRAGRWWTERKSPTGWRCQTCHPPLHLAPGETTTMNTHERHHD